MSNVRILLISLIIPLPLFGTPAPKKNRLQPLRERKTKARPQVSAKKRFVCGMNGCTKTFSTTGNRTQHHYHSKIHNPDIRPIVCPKQGCKCSYIRLSGVHDHIARAHKGKKYERKHPCRYCGKRFTKSYNAKRHEREGVCRSGPKPTPEHKCLTCCKKFITLLRLDQHKQNTKCRHAHPICNQ